MPETTPPRQSACINHGLNFADNPVTSLTMRESPLSKRLVFFLATLVAIGALLGILGPFGTFVDLTPMRRLIYWTAITVLGGLQTHAAIVIAMKALPAPKWPLPAVVVSGGTAASLLTTLEVVALEALLRPNSSVDLNFATLYFSVLLITLVLSSLFVGPLKRLTLAVELLEDGEQAGDVPFLRRIPEALGQDLLCLEMEDHYIRVHTSAGNDLILMRLRDAVEELRDYDGLQVHRSFWVARKAVVKAERKGDGAVLSLSNGMQIPVSRSRLPELRAQGLIPAQG